MPHKKRRLFKGGKKEKEIKGQQQSKGDETISLVCICRKVVPPVEVLTAPTATTVKAHGELTTWTMTGASRSIRKPQHQ